MALPVGLELVKLHSMATTVHPALAPALTASVEEAKGTPFVDESGNIVDPPNTAQLLMWFRAYQQQADAAIGQQTQRITELLGTIEQLTGLLNTKASADSLATVRQNVTALTSTVAGKADTTYVVQQFQANYELDATQTNAIKAAQDLLATDGGLLANLLAGQTTLGNQLTTLRTDVDLKAPAATVSAISGQLTTLRNTVNDPATGLAALGTTLSTKATTTDLSTLTATVGTKATTADLTTLQGTVAAIPATITQAKQDVKTELLGGAGAAYDTLQELATLDLNTANVAQALTLRVGSVETLVNNPTSGVMALNAALGTRALASDLATTNSNVAANATAISLRATTTRVATVEADVQTRLLRSGDTATGSIMVPDATTGPAAPRFSQTYGGLNSPVRAAYGFGSAAVSLGPGPLTDPTPQGRKAQVIQVFLSMKTAPTLGLNVTVKVGTTPGGSEVYSKNFLLTALPGLGNLLAGVPTSIAELPAGTILYASAVNATLANSPGSWDVIVQSYYKS